MSALTTDLRTNPQKLCEATYGKRSCVRIPHADGRHIDRSGLYEHTEWHMPMTPRRDARPPLTLDEIQRAITQHAQTVKTDGRGPILFVSGRPFREVT